MSYFGARSFPVGLTVAALLGAANGVFAQPVIYSLASNWSDVSNPNDVWRLYKAPGQLFTINQANYNIGQPAWADDVPTNSAHVPVWMKVATTDFAGFASIGSVIMHTAETGRTGTELSSVTWTAPTDGTVLIAGGVWGHKVFSDRPQTWELLVNGVNITQGDLVYADTYLESAPFDFANGSGGAAVLSRSVQANDVIELLIFRQASSPYGDMVGLNFTVSHTAIPEPGTTALIVGGCTLAGILRARYRQRRGWHQAMISPKKSSYLSVTSPHFAAGS